MSDIQNALRLWTVERNNTFLVLAPGTDGSPELPEQSLILRKATYLSNDEASGDLQRALPYLNGLSVTLLVMLPGFDGVSQTALAFTHLSDGPVSYVANGRSFLSVPARQYLAAGPSQWNRWEDDIIRNQPGYFLIGSGSPANLWRVLRAEVDFAERFNFTLLPVRPGQLPTADFTALADATIREQVQQYWTELQGALVSHQYLGVVTSAKNVAESLVHYFLVEAKYISPSNHNFAELLKKLDTIIGDPKTRNTVPFEALSLHLFEKMRILHGRTHIGRTVADGRAINPELALTVATDLVEVLRCVGFVK